MKEKKRGDRTNRAKERKKKKVTKQKQVTEKKNDKLIRHQSDRLHKTKSTTTRQKNGEKNAAHNA